VDISNMIYDSAEVIAENAKNSEDFNAFEMDLMKVFAMDSPIQEEDLKGIKNNDLTDKVVEAARSTFKRKTEKMSSIAFPVIKDIYENKSNQYESILIPITDGKKVFNVTSNLEKAYKTEAREVVKDFEKQTLLYVIDDEWKEHLRQLDELRQSVQNASYEQKDPLLIYKLESYGLFKEMIDTINKKVLEILMRGQIPTRETQQVRQGEQQHRQDYSKYRTQKDEVGRSSSSSDPTKQDTREIQKSEPIRVDKKVGRNDPCPCGSGKKYKNCHGANL